MEPCVRSAKRIPQESLMPANVFLPASASSAEQSLWPCSLINVKRGQCIAMDTSVDMLKYDLIPLSTYLENRILLERVP